MEYIILFLEGVITFISPCLLPMLPIYISYFAGKETSKIKMFVSSVAFVLGFTAVFVCLGAFASTLGRFLLDYQTALNIITGSIVIFFGLSYLDVFTLKFLDLNIKRKGDGVFGAFIFGVIFSVGWTPCVGAFLGSALAFASTSGNVLKGVLMLLTYSLGLGLPFIISSIFIESLRDTFNIIKKNYKKIKFLSGLFLIVVGILMMTGYMGYLLAFLS